MRTTVTLSPEAEDLLQQYVTYLATRLGPRASMSSVIEEALNIALPILFDRVPEKGESPREFLDRRAKNLMNRISQANMTETEVLTLMREATRCQDECRGLLLSKDKSNTMNQVKEYQECLQSFLNVYNAGAERLNKGEILPRRRAGK
ncbi:MAG TPA: hypothetical protein VLX68_01230 [Chitinivibrionales bacterium]|nr:hypothetical protein [Chitinivibrionales bacterium]